MGLLNLLIEQAKAPKGFVGKTLLKIMNTAHIEKMAWGLSKLNISDNAIILDIGCGGGKTIGMLSAKVNVARFMVLTIQRKLYSRHQKKIIMTSNVER